MKHILKKGDWLFRKIVTREYVHSYNWEFFPVIFILLASWTILTWSVHFTSLKFKSDDKYKTIKTASVLIVQRSTDIFNKTIIVDLKQETCTLSLVEWCTVAESITAVYKGKKSWQPGKPILYFIAPFIIYVPSQLCLGVLYYLT